VFSIIIQDIYTKEQRRAQLLELAKCDPSQLLKEFRSQIEAFSKKAADQLLLYRDLDYYITLEKEASTT
jgi:hypothetical protein